MLTALDQVANQHHLQLLKAILPYLAAENQRLFSIGIKFMELQNVMNFFAEGNECVSACSTSPNAPGLLDILTDLRNYCDDEEGAMIDQWIQLVTALELYSLFAQSEEAFPADQQMTDEESYE
jgi:hypothetical protein